MASHRQSIPLGPNHLVVTSSLRGVRCCRNGWPELCVPGRSKPEIHRLERMNSSSPLPSSVPFALDEWPELRVEGDRKQGHSPVGGPHHTTKDGGSAGFWNGLPMPGHLGKVGHQAGRQRGMNHLGLAPEVAKSGRNFYCPT